MDFTKCRRDCAADGGGSGDKQLYLLSAWKLKTFFSIILEKY